MRKSVILLGNYPPPYGGVPTHIKYLADYLVGRAWDVHVVSFVGATPGVEHGAGYPVYRLTRRSRWARLRQLSWADTVHAVCQGSALLRSPRLVLNWVFTANFVRELVKRHNVTLISAYHLLGAGTVGSWLNAELGVRLVTTVFGEIYSQTELHRCHIGEVCQVIAHSRRLLSCSHHCAASFKELGLDPQVEAIHYGIDVEHFRPGSGGDVVRARLGIGPDVPLVIYVARMVQEMGLHVLLAAIPEVIRSHPKAAFLIAGNRGELTADAEAMAMRFPGRVFVMPDVPYPDLPAHYDASTLAVAPSINARACLGLSIAEAMATERAVIGARVGGTAEVIVEGETGVLVPPGDAGALATAIIALVDDEAARAKMGRRGRARALSHFDKDLTNRRMEQIFEEVLG